MSRDAEAVDEIAVEKQSIIKSSKISSRPTAVPSRTLKRQPPKVFKCKVVLPSEAEILKMMDEVNIISIEFFRVAATQQAKTAAESSSPATERVGNQLYKPLSPERHRALLFPHLSVEQCRDHYQRYLAAAESLLGHPAAHAPPRPIIDTQHLASIRDGGTFISCKIFYFVQTFSIRELSRFFFTVTAYLAFVTRYEWPDSGLSPYHKAATQRDRKAAAAAQRGSAGPYGNGCRNKFPAHRHHRSPPSKLCKQEVSLHRTPPEPPADSL
eukprot:284815243_3